MHYCAACHHPMLDNNFRHICQSVLEDRVRDAKAEVLRLREQVAMLESEKEKVAVRATGEILGLREQVRLLREALISVVIGNDIAAAHNAGKLTSWPGSVPAKEARAALAATEPGP